MTMFDQRRREEAVREAVAAVDRIVLANVKAGDAQASADEADLLTIAIGYQIIGKAMIAANHRVLVREMTGGRA